MKESRELSSSRSEVTGSDLSEVIRTNFARDVFRVERKANKVTFAVKSNTRGWKAVRAKSSPAPTSARPPKRRRETMLQRLQRLGLVACLESGVKDLATNRAHMKGFGDG